MENTGPPIQMICASSGNATVSFSGVMVAILWTNGLNANWTYAKFFYKEYKIWRDFIFYTINLTN